MVEVDTSESIDKKLIELMYIKIWLIHQMLEVHNHCPFLDLQLSAHKKVTKTMLSIFIDGYELYWWDPYPRGSDTVAMQSESKRVHPFWTQKYIIFSTKH